MSKIIGGISIINNDRYVVLTNNKNNGEFIYRLENESIAYADPSENMIHNRPRIVSVYEEIIETTEKGQIIIAKNGNLVAYLSTKEVLERAEKTFYEEGQTHIYDFINQTFTIEL
jgi:type III secretion system FlhB-like substrate exporter